MTVTPTTPATSTRPARPSRRADSAFRGLALAGGVLVVAIIVAIGVFLVVEAMPAFSKNTQSFWSTKVWLPNNAPPVFGIAALAFGTLLTSVLALVMAVPVAVGIAIFVTEYAPRRLATPLGYLTDLLAAVPSVVFGLWGLYFLLPRLGGLQKFLATYFAWIPLFSGAGPNPERFSKSIFSASMILAIMILPIIAAISREVLRQVDPAQKEAALALGATRWEMVRTAMLPPSRGGLVSAVMLGLGRALGETIAVALVIGSTFNISWHILPPGGNSIAANIANQFAESNALGRSALIASGLVLFVITLAVNLVARGIIYRSGKGESSAV
jgi:phosphate transport system permease protein